MNELEEIRQQVLVLRCQTGDTRALEELYVRHSPRLGYYLRRLLDGDEAAAADVQQEVWLTVIRKVARLKVPEAFNVWLYRVARTRALDRLNAAGGSPVLETDAEAGALEQAIQLEPEFCAADAALINVGLS